MIEFRIKEKTRSLNESFRGNWRARDGVAKRQRTKAMGACPRWPGGPLLVVRVTRVSPRELDSHDNLRGALKHVVDGVAARLKIDDASPLVEWQYHQTKGEAEVVVQIWKAGEEAPSPPLGRPVEREGRARPGQKTPRGKAYGKPPTETLGVARALNAQPNYNGTRKQGNAKGRELYGQIGKPPFTVRVKSSGYDPSIPRGSPTNPVSTKAFEPSNAAEHRALLAAQEAEATFAQVQRSLPPPVPPAEPSNAAEHRALLAAQEAEATFAPALRCDKCGVDVRAMDGGRCTHCVVEAFKAIVEVS